MATVSDEGERTCPLCAEEMDLTDQQLKPCKCGYEICVWCWHQIMNMAEKDETEGRCPACRTPYDKEKVVGMAANCERMVAEINNERRLKSHKSKSKVSEGRKHLSSVRVIQRNLVYIIGLPANLADETILERKEYFGQYGKVLKVSVSKSAGGSQHPSNTNSCSVYITYAKEEEAVRCIQSVHGYILDGKSLRACFGTTKYCHTWLRNLPCNNPDCLYLHDVGAPEDSFSKDEIISAYTRARVQQITGTVDSSQKRSGNLLPPPVDEFSNSSSTSSGKLSVKTSRNPSNHVQASTLVSTSSGRSSVLPAAASWGMRASGCRESVSNTCLQGVEKEKTDIISRTSSISSMNTSVAVISNLGENGEKPPTTIEESCIVHLNDRLRQEAIHCSGDQKTTSMLFIDSSTGADRSSKPDNDNGGVGKASTSEYVDVQKSCGSDPNEVEHRWIAIDRNSERESIRSSSVEIDHNLSVEDPMIHRHPSPNSKYFSTGLVGDPLIVKNHYSGGVDNSIGKSSLSLSTDDLVSEISCVSSQVPIWSSAFETSSGPLMGGSQLPASNARLNFSEAAAHPSYLSYSSSPIKGPHHSLEHVETAKASFLGSADPTVVNASLPKKQSEFEQGGEDECTKRVICSGSVNVDASKVHISAEDDLGESSIISDILSLDLDAWDRSNSSPPSLAKLFGKSNNQNCSRNLMNSWKPQNQSQSRFSFARQEDCGDIMTAHSKSYLSSSIHLQNQSSYLQGSVNNDDITQDVFWNSLDTSKNLVSGFVSPSKADVSRVPISAPPGFSVPVRSPPPGFTSHDRIDRAFVSPSSGNQSPLLMKQSQSLSSGIVGDNIEDVEFIDPAILAVGRGTLQLPVGNNAGFDLASTISSQVIAPEYDSRLQLLMQQPFCNDQNLGFSDHMTSHFSPLNGLYTTPRFVEQPQPNSLSHLGYMSLMSSKNTPLLNSQRRGLNEFQIENDLVLSEILRNERLGFNQYLNGYEDIKFHMPSSDAFNRAYGM